MGVDPDGVELWSQTFGGVNYDYGEDLVATSDGGYALVGTTYSNTTDIECDVWVVKVDAAGEREWQAWWSEEGNEAANEYGLAITENADGDMVVVGATATAEDGWVIKADANEDFPEAP